MALAPGFAHVAPLQPALLKDPLAFLSAEHGRQTVLLRHLERLARAPLSRAARVLALALVGWLTVELPLHIADEELSLHPRLRGFDSEGLLPRLRVHHQQEQQVMPLLLAGLLRAAEGQPPPAGFLDAALAFVASHHRHLALEEATVLPLARASLGPEALADVAHEMAARRG